MSALQLVNSKAIEALLLAADEAEKQREPSTRDVYDPYRETIQQCLDRGLSVQKIFDTLKANGVGTQFAPTSFQKYIRTTGYVKAKGKYAGMDRVAVKKAMIEEASHKPPGELFENATDGKVRSLLGQRNLEGKEEGAPVTPQVAKGPL